MGPPDTSSRRASSISTGLWFSSSLLIVFPWGLRGSTTTGSPEPPVVRSAPAGLVALSGAVDVTRPVAGETLGSAQSGSAEPHDRRMVRFRRPARVAAME